jgi:hypothetical protein
MYALIFLIMFAGAEPTSATTPAAKPAAAKEDKVCVTKTEPGSRFKSRVCYSKAEHEQRQLEERQALDRMQRVPARSN